MRNTNANKPEWSPGQYATENSKLPTWSWFLIIPVGVVLLVLAAKAIFKSMKGGKKPKTVEK